MSNIPLRPLHKSACVEKTGHFDEISIPSEPAKQESKDREIGVFNNLDHLSSGLPWRKIQRENFTDWKKLLLFLGFDPEAKKDLVIPSAKFPLNLPKRLAEKIEKGNWDDPVLRQFLPIVQELESSASFKADPVFDQTFRKRPKLLQKYHGRALLLATGACAMNCRFCFRQNFDYETQEKSFAEELDLIAKDPTLSEVILSGGDPLSLGEGQLQALFDTLEKIPHVKRIRFHTRFPIGIPERIDEPFLKMLAGSSKQIIFIVHINHPKELDADIFNHLKKIQKLAIPVLTHTVLLRGVNDQLETLKNLFELLVDHGIMPYYINQLDRVQGAAHFEVPEEEGKRLMDRLQELLSGYAIPKYAKEIPHRLSKTVI